MAAKRSVKPGSAVTRRVSRHSAAPTSSRWSGAGALGALGRPAGCCLQTHGRMPACPHSASSTPPQALPLKQCE